MYFFILTVCKFCFCYLFFNYTCTLHLFLYMEFHLFIYLALLGPTTLEMVHKLDVGKSKWLHFTPFFFVFFLNLNCPQTFYLLARFYSALAVLFVSPYRPVVWSRRNIFVTTIVLEWFLTDYRFCPILGNETSPESFLLHNALARKPKRIRTAFSPSQLLRLEHAFEKNHYVVGAERKQLAHSLSLTETQVRHSDHVAGVVPHLTSASTFLTCKKCACLMSKYARCCFTAHVHTSSVVWRLSLNSQMWYWFMSCVDFSFFIFALFPLLSVFFFCNSRNVFFVKLNIWRRRKKWMHAIVDWKLRELISIINTTDFYIRVPNCFSTLQ